LRNSFSSSRGADYPEGAPERDRWILERRPARSAVDPSQPHAFLIEPERSDTGALVSMATIFLTNRECPYRCLMCDLWRNTLSGPTPTAAIPAQIDYALARLPPAHQIKLYNSGSFFDPAAIPVNDYPAIAERTRSFDRVIVESHPALIGKRSFEFQKQLNGTPLEVAMGLETVHPDILPRLNKRMTLPDFQAAAATLATRQIALRVFVLLKPPFLEEGDALAWAQRSVDFAFDQGASVVSIIPTRPGNGALDALQEAGQFSMPRLATLEQALAYGIKQNRGRVFADLWDLARFSRCAVCFAARQRRLEWMNREQQWLPDVECHHCERGF
jgi:radical SAM enzyme (TIGR01210 family)